MQKPFTLIMLIGTLACLAGCQREVALGEETPFFPLDLGYRWTYDEYVPGQSDDGIRYTWEVVGTRNWLGEPYVMIQQNKSGHIDSLYFRVEGDQVFQYSAPQEMEYLIFDGEAEIGDSWAYPMNDSATITYTLLAEREPIRLEAGTYSGTTSVKVLREYFSQGERWHWHEEIVYFKQGRGIVGRTSRSPLLIGLGMSERETILTSGER